MQNVFSISVFKLHHTASLLKTLHRIPTALRINAKSSLRPVVPSYLSVSWTQTASPQVTLAFCQSLRRTSSFLIQGLRSSVLDP